MHETGPFVNLLRSGRGLFFGCKHSYRHPTLREAKLREAMQLSVQWVMRPSDQCRARTSSMCSLFAAISRWRLTSSPVRGMHLGIWNDLNVNITERADKNYSTHPCG